MDDASTQADNKPWYFLPERGFSSMTPEQYIKERITQFRHWYDVKASKAKRRFMVMRSITVVGGAIVPVLINLSDSPIIKYLNSFISLLVVILVSLESVYHYREQWKNYRSTEQLLAKEYYNFVTGEGAYRNLQPQEAFITMVERIENAIESENASTLNVMTTLSEKKTGSDQLDNPNKIKNPPKT
ncbi:DUF4231 domain-containing protein [Mucilaginibacter paludis]|uniref:DUF4231 domain-containing protein n=1 Tax=Mucilaginibacter paludis DSM 18603 TaxID=714943 RepID=H1YGU7_9SPHI|nr:DUF4231 domain-containing protein [Mucilaginibacter paludis]EHQ26376.1 hypothetical protein Mucpa_2242 [Mucilaginibacter paludis DSM 18603]